MTEPLAIALDTDIGTDVDDLLALATILGSPELSLSEVTTVYGDVELRARIVAKVFALTGTAAPHITPGLAETRSGRPVWWPGHEGETIADLDAQSYTAADDAIAQLAAAPTVAAIGPLTNLAAAIERPGHSVERVVIMGGEFSAGIVEHNIRCDADAAATLFASGVEVVAVGLDQTERIRLEHDQLTAIEESGDLGALIAAEMRRFWDFAEQTYNVPHDPIAIAYLARPDLFTTARGRVVVDTEADDPGLTTFTPDPDGPHLIVTDMDTESVANEILRRILAATTN